MDISFECFGSLLDIDKLIQKHGWWNDGRSFSSLLDIVKLFLFVVIIVIDLGFSSLFDMSNFSFSLAGFSASV